MLLIGLAGPPGAGRSTVAIRLAHGYSFQRLLFRADRAFTWQQQFAERFSFHRARNTPGVVLNVHTAEEADFIRDQGGQIWHIQRPGYLTRAGDAYHGIPPYSTDRGLLNDGPIDALYNRVDKLLIDLEPASQA